MGALLQPTSTPVERDNSKLALVIAFAGIALVVTAAVLLTREKPKTTTVAPPPLYASNLKFSDFKLSQAENLVGTGVTYFDGSVTNMGDKTVTQATVRVTFRDSYGQVAQIEEPRLRILRNSGTTDDAVDLSMAPLQPGQVRTFRLIFERLSKQWNQGYPELEITDVTLK